jgi:hypothetical protein
MAILASSTIFLCAKISLENARLKSPIITDPGEYDALSSILFAAITVETFLNELLEETDGKPLMKLIKKDNQKMPTKLRILSEYFSDNPISGSDPSFTRYSLLHALRNRCVHIEPGDDLDGHIEMHKEIFNRLNAQGIKKKV